MVSFRYGFSRGSACRNLINTFIAAVLKVMAGIKTHSAQLQRLTKRIDSSGRLIGVTTAIYSPSGAYAGIGFAIPVDTVKWVVPELIQQDASPEKIADVTLGMLNDRDRLEKMIAAGKRAEEILGRKLRSNFIDAGPVPHKGINYDKEKGIL